MEMFKQKIKKIKGKPSGLKEFFDKTYTLDHNENYENFLGELGIRKNTRMKAIDSKPTVVLSQDGDKYVLSTTYPEGRHIKVKFKPGEEVQRRQSNKYVSSVFLISDNKLIEEQCFDDKKITIEREFRKKELLVTMEVNNVQCLRLYTESKSKFSVDTETSRQMSIWEKTSNVDTQSEETEEVSETQGEIDETNVCF